MLLGVSNGVIDLRTGRVRDADRDDYITRLAPIAYDREAEAPRWNAFLAQVTGGDQELAAYLKRAVGYSLTGQTVEQCLFLLFGLGANGKSTFLAILRALLGDYAASTDVQTWMARDRSGPNNDLAALRGARVVVSSEVEDGTRFAEVLLKLATGGDTLKARFLYSEFFEFRPTFKLWIAANHKPVIRGDDLAIWRRIRLVPFTVTIPPEQQDRNLEASLRDELPGILNWAIEGCLEWQRHGLTTPAAVQAAGNDYRAEMDHFSQFLDECCVLDPKRTVRAVVVYDSYTGWCRTQGIEHPRTLPRFWSKLAERGITKLRDEKGIEYRGITLRGAVHDY
jgi:putative DNA primase/helicase